jgi:predicted nucleic acid-binding protein
LTVVIDASMALVWVFEREQAWRVPGLGHLEVANALLVAECRGVIAVNVSDLFLDRLRSLPIRTDTDGAQERQPRVFSLARIHGLSSYDAAYLALAQRLGATVASFDRRLNQAAADHMLALYR